MCHTGENFNLEVMYFSRIPYLHLSSNVMVVRKFSSLDIDINFSKAHAINKDSPRGEGLAKLKDEATYTLLI